MQEKKATKKTKDLYRILTKHEIHCILEYWDGKKHVDMCIPEARLYIEIDGLAHYINPKQISSDFKRDYYSMKEEFDTLRIPNAVIDQHLEEVAESIIKLINVRIEVKR